MLMMAMVLVPCINQVNPNLSILRAQIVERRDRYVEELVRQGPLTAVQCSAVSLLNVVTETVEKQKYVYALLEYILLYW